MLPEEDNRKAVCGKTACTELMRGDWKRGLPLPRQSSTLLKAKTVGVILMMCNGQMKKANKTCSFYF